MVSDLWQVGENEGSSCGFLVLLVGIYPSHRLSKETRDRIRKLILTTSKKCSRHRNTRHKAGIIGIGLPILLPFLSGTAP